MRDSIKNKKEKPDIIAMAKKKRHIHLLQKLQKSKSLSKSELKELQAFEEAPALPPGVVKNRDEVAKVFHVSVRTVHNWVRDGMPVTAEGNYNIIAVREWRAARKEVKEGKGKGKKENWEDKLRKYRAQRAKLELRQLEGKLISLSEVEAGRIARIIAVKRALLALPKAIAPVIAGMGPREVQAYLTERIRDVILKFTGRENINEKKGKKEKSLFDME